MNKYFKKGFEKEASVGAALSLLATLAMPSVNKRLVQNTFEMSKRKALGLSVENESKGIFGSLGTKINKDVDFVDDLPDGFRKKLNKLFMKEGPTAILYAPAEKGKQLGKSLASAANEAPFIRGFLGDITSVDNKRAAAAMDKLTKLLKKVKDPKVLTALGVGGGALAAMMASSLIGKKRGGYITPSLSVSPHISTTKGDSEANLRSD